MQSEELLLLTEQYFTSGYNNIPWSKLNNSELDVFYSEIAPINHSEDFLSELKSALDILFLRDKRIKIVNDDSLEFKILHSLRPDISTFDLPYDHTPAQSFIELCQREYLLNDPEMIFALSVAQSIGTPLIFSRWAQRIVNANYSPDSEPSLPPYYVFVENERLYRLMCAQMELGISLSWNFLRSSPKLFRSFFYHPKHIHWLNKSHNPHPHNYEIERSIFKDAYVLLRGNDDVILHRIPWPLGEWSKDLNQMAPEQQAASPMHILLEKIFGLQTDLNSCEKGLYGSRV